MATETVPVAVDARPTGAFRALQLQCAYELDRIARMLPDLVPLDEDQAHYAVKALAGRMLRLTSALMSLADDDKMPVQEIDQMVNLSGNGQG